jgi:hypothetical protein
VRIFSNDPINFETLPPFNKKNPDTNVNPTSSKICNDIYISGEWNPNYLINSKAVKQAFEFEKNIRENIRKKGKFEKIYYKSHSVIIPSFSKITNFTSSNPLYKFYYFSRTYFSPQVLNSVVCCL